MGEVDGPLAGLAAVAHIPGTIPRRTAVQAYLHDRAGDHEKAKSLYLAAASEATNSAERNHLLRLAVQHNAD